MPKALKGMNDILPGDVDLWQSIETKARSVFRCFGYNEIRTPILEEKSLFVKSVGGETDIVAKEMFAFTDRGDREIALRPEGTAAIVRAYLEANLHKLEPFQKLYYIGPMFRAERPQAGRLRQFHQIGAEVIGSSDPAVDAEIILLMSAILDGLGIRNSKLRLNNLGCSEDKAKLSRALKELLSDKLPALCEDCKKRIDTNALRVLDCKNESCRNLVRGVFKSVEFLCAGCAAHFDKVLAYLDRAKLKYCPDPYIVRGLDYYTGTVFEVSHEGLGAQDAIGAGGRYDSLISDLGGPGLGATGFALGIERIIMAAAKQGIWALRDERRIVFPIVYIATMGEDARNSGLELMGELRGRALADEGSGKITFTMDYENKSLKAQMREADKMLARVVLIIGEDELKDNKVTIKDMKKKDAQVSADRGLVMPEVRKILC